MPRTPSTITQLERAAATAVVGGLIAFTGSAGTYIVAFSPSSSSGSSGTASALAAPPSPLRAAPVEPAIFTVATPARAVPVTSEMTALKPAPRPPQAAAPQRASRSLVRPPLAAPQAAPLIQAPLIQAPVIHAPVIQAPAPVAVAPVAPAAAPRVMASGDPRTIAQQMLASRGEAGQFSCLDALWTRESGWSVYASNASGAYGIPQALPGAKMASFGADWASNPATQIAWGLSYIDSTYGSPCGAWGHSQANGWY